MSNAALGARNWFVALNGKIVRRQTLAEIQASWTDEFKSKHAGQIPVYSLEYQRKYPKAWEASSGHVPEIKAFGDTPEEAIREFEEKMRLP